MASWTRKFQIPCFRGAPMSENRTVFVGKAGVTESEIYITEKFPDNKIVTTHYTYLNFLPKNLFEQLQRVANFYFLLIGIIQFLIDSPVNPATSVLPLVFVLAVTAVKQGYEDWLRRKADRDVNNRIAYVVRHGELVPVKSMDIKVGDIVRVEVNHSFPCDLVLLASHSDEGSCSITTANLDGETNLKTHVSVPETRYYQSTESFVCMNAKIVCQHPLADLYKFVGNMYINDENGEQRIRPLNTENVLLRGAMLKNTPFIFGCAIYTGQQTKMALNSKFKRTKSSRVERALNRYLLVFLALLLTETVICTSLKYIYQNRPRVGSPWYIPEEGTVTAKMAAGDFFSFLVLFNYIIPISLYVTIELQKFLGSMFFGWDVEMYDVVTNQRAKANTSDLNEELGQIEYLFTDKTGTLTENDMQFRQCSIAGRRFVDHGGMLCERLDMADGQPNIIHTLEDKIIDFLEVLALCHTVRVEKKDRDLLNGYHSQHNHPGFGFEFEYQASSPDEKAFVEACRRYGVVFHGTKNDQSIITVNGEKRMYKLHHVLDFDAKRRCMSVIVENSAGEVMLLCKGAESSLIQRSTGGARDSTMIHVKEYATVGLRTMVVGRRKMTRSQYAVLDAKLINAKQALSSREKQLSEVYDELEQDLALLGATAVEDRLQDGVPETIVALREAGIKIWVLTGDKEETAVNISYAAGHFKQGLVELHLTHQEDAAICSDTLRKLQTKVYSSDQQSNFGLVVDGTSLSYALKYDADALLSVCLLCVAVLCCRMSPIQKAEIVKLVKEGKDDPVTAAIGDGANDVSMIQEADVGLGIMGKEGRQAVRCSDYAFGRFRYLMRALLVHGHWFYVRLSTLVHYFFYKNIAFITAELYYAIWSMFSQQTVYDSFFLMFFNTAFTALPILAYGLLEQDVSAEQLISQPALYRKISRNSLLSIRHAVLWNLSGIWHSLVFFFGVYFLFGDDATLSADGEMLDVWSFGSVILMLCVWTVTFKLLLVSRYISWIHFGILVFTLTATAVSITIYNAVVWPPLLVDRLDMYGVFNETMRHGMVWLAMAGIFALAILPDFLFKTVVEWHGFLRSTQTYGTNKGMESSVIIPANESARLRFLASPLVPEIPHPPVYDVTHL